MKKENLLGLAREKCPALVPVILGATLALGEYAFVLHEGWVLTVIGGEPVDLRRERPREGLVWSRKEALNLLGIGGRQVRPVLKGEERDQANLLPKLTRGRSSRPLTASQVKGLIERALLSDGWRYTAKELVEEEGVPQTLISFMLANGMLEERGAQRELWVIK